MMKHLFNLKKSFISALGIVLLLTFQLFSVQSAHATTCAAAIVLNPAALPVNQALVCGTTNDVTSASFGITTSTLYVGGLESLYRLTPTITGSYTISYTGQSWSSINVFNGCPTTAGTTGVGGIASSATSKSVTVTLTAGVIYYIMFDTWPTPASPCAGTFTIVGPPMVPTTGNNAYSSCSGTIYDNGGATTNYANNSNGYSVINPATAGNNVQISGTISTESGWDFVRIYNGTGTTGTLLWSGSGTATVPVITSTLGPLTVQFTSDGSVNGTGFALNFTCVPAACSGIPNAGTATISSASGCVGAALTLSATGLTISGGITYQWQSSPNGTTWTNITGATAATYAFTSSSGLTYYRLTTTCSNSASSASTNVVSYNGNVTNTCSCLAYGASNATSTADEEIFNVTFGTINNTSTCATVAGGTGSVNSMYSNYTGVIAATDVVQGGVYPISLTLGYCGATAYSNMAAVYIDFNQNGSFADAGENVYTKPYGAGVFPSYIVTGNISIPVSASLGLTRMRIVYVESSVVSPTGTFTWGETEDYCVNILLPPPCAGTPAPGNTTASMSSVPVGTTVNLGLQNATIGTGVTYQWQTSSSATGPWTNITGATSSTYSFVFAANAWYQCIVTCSASGSTTSNPIQITQSACIPTSTYGSASGYYGIISNVSFGTMNHNSTGLSAPWYASYPTSVATTSVVAGTTQTLSVTSYYYDIVGAWFDWNNNYIYEASEYVAVNPLSNSAGVIWTGTASVLVPTNASIGIVNMRIRTNYYGYALTSADPCTTTLYGETKDYKITIVAPPAAPPINATAFTNCAAGVTLTASVPAPTNVSYYWQTSATGTSTANGVASYVVYGNGTYYLRALNTLYNVWGVASSITVTSFPALAAPTPIIVSTPSCPSANLTIGAAPSGINYYWQGTNSAGFSTTNNATAAYNTSTTGTYYVRAKDANGCWSDNTSSLVTIYTSPNATANFVAPVSCGTNGQIVFNVSGSGTVFLSDFSTPTLPAGTVSAGNDFNASVNGRMQLTSPVGSKNGGVVIPNNTGIASNDFQIDFDFVTISAGVAAADGFSYSYGPDVVALPDQTAVQTALGAAPATGVSTLCPENGSGTGLKLAFDAYPNTGGCPVANGASATLPNTSIGNSPGVYLMYNSTSLHQGSTCPGVLYYSNNTSWAASGIAGTVTSTHVTIKINASGQVSMWQNGVQVVNNVSLGAGYLAADKSTWKHAFTARTGGLYEGHYIDNLDIHYNLYEYSIDNGATWTTQNPIPVPIGMYQTKVRYAGVVNGCETSATIGLASNGAVNIGSALINGSPTANICSGTNFTVMAAGLPNAGGGFTYQWQSSTDNGVTWTNVGTLMIAYIDLTTSATQNTKYRLQVICPTVTTYTSVATVTIFQTPAFTLSASNNGIWCDNYTGAQTITASNAGITYAWSPATSLSAATGQTVTSTTPAGTQSTYTVIGTNVAGCSLTQTISVGLPYINVTSNVSNFCGTGGAAVLTATTNAGANASFTWSNLSPTTATMTPNGATANVNITATSNFQVSIASYNGNPGCASVGNFSLGVYPLPSATVTTSASGVCPGTSAVINSGLSSGNFSATCTPYVNYPAPSNATYLANTGTAQVALASGSLDDGGWSGIPLGFNFNFFGTSYNTINVGTNGVLQFGAYNATALGDFIIGALPNTVDPLGAIYICANDLVEYNANNYVRYWTDGFAPNRRFIIEYYASQFGNAANNVRAKAILYETIGVVDIQGIEIMSTNSKSIGVNNATGTVGAAAPNCPANTPNYWSAQTATIPAASPQAWRFTPPANYTTVWTATAGGTPIVVASGTNIFSLNVAPTVTTNYSISYTNQTTGCTNAPGSAQVTMAVLGVNAPTGVNAVTSSALVCPGDPFTLSTNYTGIVDGLTYQWQSAPSATGPWTNITGATAATSVQNMTATTYYRCNIQSCGGTAVATAAVLVTYNTNCIAVPASGNNSITTCNGVIFDNGGLSGNYAASSNGYTVIYPSTPGYMVQIQGTQVTESSFDYLQIYNGAGTTGTQLYNFSGTANVGPLTSTAGPLTVNFYADPSVQYAGFSLTSTCIPPTPTVTSNITGGNICIGSPITLTAAITVPGTVYWFAGGCATTGQVGTGLSLTVSPTTTTTYYARLFDGTVWSTCSSYTVTVNTYPVINAGPDVNICNGATTQLSGSVTNATAPGSFTQTYSGSGYDNSNFYIGGLTAGAPAGAVITSITYTATIGTWCTSWYNWLLYVNGTNVTSGCDGTFTYNGLNGQPANGQLFQIRSQDNDAFSDFVTMGLTVTVNYAVAASTVLWTPSLGLSSTTILNPVASPTTTTTYNMAVTSAQGCTSNDQVVVTVQQLPVVTIANQTVSTFCNGGSVVLAPTPTAQNYAWSQGSTPVGTGSTYTATTSGTYSLVVTNYYPATQLTCSSLPSNAITVTVNPNPNTTITPSGATSICQGSSVTLNAGATNSTPVTYLWSNGATTSSIVATASGSPTVAITNNFGCTTTSAPTTVTVLPLPVATITAGGSTTFCAGGTVALNASAGSTYLWSPGGATTQTLNATTAGNYSVTVSGANGCSATSTPIAVNVLAAPANAPIAGPASLCVGNSIALTNPVSNGVWSSSNTSVLNVNASTGAGVGNGIGTATITYTTTGANGCTSAQTTSVSVTGSPVASISASGATAICQGGTVTLTANPAQSYLWNNNATTQSITVSNGGAYSVVISNGPGCSSAASAPTTVTVNPLPVAAITANGSTVFCQGGSVNLTATGGTTYVWNNNATGATLNASTAGNYSVTVTNANGCTATSNSIAVSVNALPTASITANGPTTFCQGANVVLTATGNGSIAWTNNQNTPAITVAASGNYAYTITDANGCTATSTPTTVTVTALPVVPSITGANNVCAGASTLFANTMTGGTWSSSNGSIASVDALGSVTGAGVGSATISYQVTQNGCSATSTKVINVQAAPVATISALGSTSFCIGSNVTLVSSPGVTYAWSNGATSQNVTLNTAGPITVQVTGTNGCSATSAPQTITVNALPVLDPIAGASVVCVGSNGTLTNTTGGGSWSSANANVATVNAATGVVSGNAAGTANMTYTYTNANGCTNAVSAPVVIQALPSAATTVAGSTVFCQGGSVTLTAPTAASYLWTPGGATTQSIAATAGGSYTVQVSNGACSATSPATIVTVHALPTASITSTATAICQGGTVTLTAAPATSYAWSNGATTQSITVTAAGNYGVTVSNVYGCTSTSAPTAISVSALPSSYISAAGPTTFCNGSSVVLSANPGASYVWSNGATTQNITANATGNYFVTITNAAGCSSVSNEIQVNAQQTFTATATAVGPTAVCDGAFVTLVASPGASYLWSNGATTQGINAGVNGNYSVTVTNALGCSSTSTNIPVTVLPVPTAGITAGGATTFCEGGSVVLTGTGGNTYVWNNSINGSTITATQGGTYIVTAYAANGCSDAAEVTVTVNEVPSATLILDGNAVLCPGESLVISAQPNNTYAWSNNATTQSITVTTPGTYSAVLTGLNGCTSNSDVVTVTAGAATSSTINATGYSSYTLNEVVYTQSGTYTQTLTNAAGCDSTITLNLTLTVGIEEGNITDVNLYPNPTSESFTIKTSAPLYGTYSIVDAQGKLVFSGEMTGTDTHVNISSVARGIYYLRIPELSEPLRVVKN